jgi:UDP-N-acetylmuramate: L-alanyl-gamma-D-glutamyl-meso-diaminopimelate ligase
MAGIAILARQLGYEVEGSDMNIYPPMSTQLIAQGIHYYEGYDSNHIAPDTDYVIIGNVIKRGNPALEYILANRIPYISGPQWLYENVLRKRHVLAVAGTHGKTTTSSLLAWILEARGLQPGFLIGGIPENFGQSARLGAMPYFVIEADEYDSAFCDKRSKFIHYHPQTLILNNLEFDHADIFNNLDAIKQQFHQLIKTIASNDIIIYHANDRHLQEVLALGCYTPTMSFAENGHWQAQLIAKDGSHFSVSHMGHRLGEVKWSLIGNHNVYNALAAIAGAYHIGIKAIHAMEALAEFKNVKRRLEIKGSIQDIVIYDDFAHHPTAIATTLAGLRAKIGKKRLIAVVEFASYTMRTGIHKERLAQAFKDADLVLCKKPNQSWGLEQVLPGFSQPAAIFENTNRIIDYLAHELRPGDQVLILSNSGFDGIHQKLMDALVAR